MGIGSSIGEGRAANAARAAITSPLLEASIEGARRPGAQHRRRLGPRALRGQRGGRDHPRRGPPRRQHHLRRRHRRQHGRRGAGHGDRRRLRALGGGSAQRQATTWPRASSPRPSRWTSSPTPPGPTKSSTWVTTISTSPPSSASDEVAERLHSVRLRIEAGRRRPVRHPCRRRHKGLRPRGRSRSARRRPVRHRRELRERARGEGGRGGGRSRPLRQPLRWHFLGAIQTEQGGAARPGRRRVAERVAGRRRRTDRALRSGRGRPRRGRHDGALRAQRLPARRGARAGAHACATPVSTCAAS